MHITLIFVKRQHFCWNLVNEIHLGNCLVQPTGNRDLEKISIAFLIQSVDLLHFAHGVGTRIKLQHDEPTFPKQIDRLNSYTSCKLRKQR